MKVGIIGAGWVGTNRHLPALRRLENVSISVIFDRNLSKAQAVAEKLPGCVATDDLERLLAESLDAVSICTPPWSHAELAVAALNSGVHVLTEKPMAMNSEEAARMVRAADDAQRVLCVSHNLLFSNSVQKADRWLGGERPHYVLGLQMSSDRRRLPTWYQELPGGLLFDELPHFLYLMDHFLEDLAFQGVRSIRPEGARHPTTVEIQLSGARGDAQIVVLTKSPLSEWHLSLVARDQALDLDLFRDIAVRVPEDDDHGAVDILKTSTRAVTGHLAGFVTSGVRLATRQLSWGHDRLVRHFVEAVESGTAPPVTVEQASRMVAVTDRILENL